MSVILTKRFKDQEIIFEQKNNSTQLYLNATKTAKNFNKDINEWKRLPSTKEYIESIIHSGIIPERQMFIVKQGGKPQEQGTMDS